MFWRATAAMQNANFKCRVIRYPLLPTFALSLRESALGAASGPSPGRPTDPAPRRAWTPSFNNALRPLLHDDESQQ